MLQIEHRVALLCLRLILGRGVHHGAAPAARRLAVILHRTYLTLGHATLRTVVVALVALGHLYSTRLAAASEEGIGGGVDHRHAVDNEEIVVEAHHQRVGTSRPHALCVALHVVLLAADVHLHTLCLGSTQTEPRAAIAVQTREVVARHVVYGGRGVLHYIFGLLMSVVLLVATV